MADDLPVRTIPSFPEKHLGGELRKTSQDFANALLRDGIPKNTRRAYQADVAYFWAWMEATQGHPIEPSYPIHLERVIEFITDHLGDIDPEVDARLTAPRDGVKGNIPVKRRPGPNKLSTLRRRLFTLSAVHRLLKVENPVASHDVKMLLRSARNKFAGTAAATKKKEAILADTLTEHLQTVCDDSLRGLRDRALLMIGFAAGGRRVSELAAISVEDLRTVSDPATGSKSYLITIRRSKTDQGGVGRVVPAKGTAAQALAAWLEAAGITSGAVFRGITKGDTLRAGMTPRAVSGAIKARLVQAGLDPKEYSAHSLRAGFLTEAGRQGKNLADVMAVSLHTSYQVALGYHRAGAALNNPAADLLNPA